MYGKCMHAKALYEIENIEICVFLLWIILSKVIYLMEQLYFGLGAVITQRAWNKSSIWTQ